MGRAGLRGLESGPVLVAVVAAVAVYVAVFAETGDPD